MHLSLSYSTHFLLQFLLHPCGLAFGFGTLFLLCRGHHNSFGPTTILEQG